MAGVPKSEHINFCHPACTCPCHPARMVWCNTGEQSEGRPPREGVDPPAPDHGGPGRRGSPPQREAKL